MTGGTCWQGWDTTTCCCSSSVPLCPHLLLSVQLWLPSQPTTPGSKEEPARTLCPPHPFPGPRQYFLVPCPAPCSLRPRKGHLRHPRHSRWGLRSWSILETAQPSKAAPISPGEEPLGWGRDPVTLPWLLEPGPFYKALVAAIHPSHLPGHRNTSIPTPTSQVPFLLSTEDLGLVIRLLCCSPQLPVLQIQALGLFPSSLFKDPEVKVPGGLSRNRSPRPWSAPSSTGELRSPVLHPQTQSRPSASFSIRPG